MTKPVGGLKAPVARERPLRGLQKPLCRYVGSYDIALIYVGVGEKDKALRWLKTACEEREGQLSRLQVEPSF